MKIALLVPAYNVEKYVAFCLDSVLNQTYKNFEVFIMNDGSRDNTLKILNEYAKSDERIHVFSQQNKGITKTRNSLLEKISDDTDFILYLDSDDMIHPKTLETAVYYIQKYDSDVVEWQAKRIEHDETSPQHQDIDYSNTKVNFLNDMNIFWSNKTRIGPWINIWNKLYKWDKIKPIRFSEKLAFEDDYFYNTQVHSVISSKVVIPNVLYYYRKNPTSITQKINFEKYITTTANRIQLSYDTFLKTNKVPQKYRKDFEYDLAMDCYRMVIRKNLKKNKSIKNCRDMFILSSDYINHFYNDKIVDFSRLSFAKRCVVFLTRHRMFILAKILARFF